MNDFTKDELYMLNRAIINLEKIDDNDSMESKLYKKIQNMIDNYCDHNFTKSCYECGALQCKKCFKYLSYEEINE